ncbi:UNVERIFIED_CONTAM: hypothetical protein HHA_461930 [Hammondia hammondi]|eukprot:XP_008883870.1 hypothetical protein HHA_461930 [Hammondia hammondi]
MGSHAEPPSPLSPAAHFWKKAINAKSVLTAVVEIFSEHSPMFGEEMEERDPHTLGPAFLIATYIGRFFFVPAALSVVGQLIAELLALARREQEAVGKDVVDVLASLIVERNAPLLLGREQENGENDAEGFSGRSVDEAHDATRSQARDASRGTGRGVSETEPLTDNDLKGHEGRGDKTKEIWVLSAAAREERQQRQSRKGDGHELRLQDDKDYQLEPTMAEVSLRLAPSTVCVLLEAFEAADVFRDLLKPVQRLLASRLNLFSSYASFLLRALPPSEAPLVPSSRPAAHVALSPSAAQSPWHASVSAGGNEHLTHAAGSRNQFQRSATATDWSHGYVPCADLVSLLALSAACVGVPYLTGDALWTLLQGHDLATAALNSLRFSHSYLPMSVRDPSMVSASSELPSAPEVVPSLPPHRTGLHQLYRGQLVDADNVACNVPAQRTSRDKDGEWISEETREESAKHWQAGREAVAVRDVLSTALARLASPLRAALSHVLSMIATYQSFPSVQELCLSHLPFFFVQWLSLRKRIRHTHDSTMGVRARFERLEAHAVGEQAKQSERGGETGHTRLRPIPAHVKETLSETLSDEDEEDSICVGPMDSPEAAAFVAAATGMTATDQSVFRETCTSLVLAGCLLTAHRRQLSSLVSLPLPPSSASASPGADSTPTSEEEQLRSTRSRRLPASDGYILPAVARLILTFADCHGFSGLSFLTACGSLARCLSLPPQGGPADNPEVGSLGPKPGQQFVCLRPSSVFDESSFSASSSSRSLGGGTYAAHRASRRRLFGQCFPSFSRDCLEPHFFVFLLSLEYTLCVPTSSWGSFFSNKKEEMPVAWSRLLACRPLSLPESASASVLADACALLGFSSFCSVFASGETKTVNRTAGLVEPVRGYLGPPGSLRRQQQRFKLLSEVAEVLLPSAVASSARLHAFLLFLLRLLSPLAASPHRRTLRKNLKAEGSASSAAASSSSIPSASSLSSSASSVAAVSSPSACFSSAVSTCLLLDAMPGASLSNAKRREGSDVSWQRGKWVVEAEEAEQERFTQLLLTIFLATVAGASPSTLRSVGRKASSAEDASRGNVLTNTYQQIWQQDRGTLAVGVLDCVRPKQSNPSCRADNAIC